MLRSTLKACVKLAFQLLYLLDQDRAKHKSDSALETLKRSTAHRVIYNIMHTLCDAHNYIHCAVVMWCIRIMCTWSIHGHKRLQNLVKNVEWWPTSHMQVIRRHNGGHCNMQSAKYNAAHLPFAGCGQPSTHVMIARPLPLSYYTKYWLVD